MPAYEILTRVRSLGLDPIGEPLRRGPYYILQAYDRRGGAMRVVADAQLGDVISVTPSALVTLPGPGTVGGARIIHVPSPAEEQASLAPDDGPDFDDPADSAPPARQAVQSRPKHAAKPAARHVTRQEPATRRRPFSVDAPPPPPPPPVERRAILTAPPPPAAPLHDGPTPLRPTPRFGAPSQATVVIPPPPEAAPPAPEPPAADATPADAPPAQD
jgi:hypothetical protein